MSADQIEDYEEILNKKQGVSDALDEKRYEADRYLKIDSNREGDQASQEHVDFDDDKEWTAEDLEANKMSEAKYQSKIVEKYFNKGAKGKKPPLNSQSQQEQEKEVGKPLTKEEELAIVQKYSNEKIEELTKEIEKYKMENERVKKMRTKYEELLKQANKKEEEFQKQKENEIQEFEQWKEEERKKIRNEKKLQERQFKQLQNQPNRKEREEIENYKKQVDKLKEDMKIKDQRYKLNMDRMKKQLEE